MYTQRSLEALAVDDGWAALVVLLLGDPHLLEGRQGSQDRTTDPHRVLALWRSDDLDLHGRWGERGDLLLHAVGDTWVHRSTARHDDVAIEILSDINVALHDRVECDHVDTAALKTQDARLEERLRSTETLVANGDDLAIRKFVRLLQAGALAGSLNLLVEVEGDVAELLLDVTDNFTLGRGGEKLGCFPVQPNDRLFEKIVA